ncbi:hypothetical protein [Microbispora sp. H10830]|uniref:hypothetical protein n=1 Tax=Microbispora sp. H10830 TaxID=2729109 RepID=UPI001601976D|nr:hypothetical protein [Microbispora sp. H10830]
MSYDVQAVIASTQLLRTVTAALTHTRLGSLRQGFSLLPITDELFDSVVDYTADRVQEFRRLPNGFDRTIASWSQAGPVAYVEAEYFGGTGEQRAAVWHDERLVLGPLKVGEKEPFPVEGSPISQALRYLGARNDGLFDEFSSVGLGEHRSNEGWVS